MTSTLPLFTGDSGLTTPSTQDPVKLPVSRDDQSGVYTCTEYVLSWVHNMTLTLWASQASWASREKVFFHQSNCIPDVKFFDSLTGWMLVTLATLRWNRNQVYSSVTPTLATLCWREHHIVNLALHVICVFTVLYCTCTIHRLVKHCFCHFQGGQIVSDNKPMSTTTQKSIAASSGQVVLGMSVHVGVLV